MNQPHYIEQARIKAEIENAISLQVETIVVRAKNRENDVNGKFDALVKAANETLKEPQLSKTLTRLSMDRNAELQGCNTTFESELNEAYKERTARLVKKIFLTQSHFQNLLSRQI